MRKCDRKRITEGSLRNVPALIRRANGIDGISRPNVHFAFADCRSCVDVRVEFIDRQNFPIACSTQHDDLAMLTGDVDLAVDTDGRGVVVFERARQTRLLEYLAGLSV